MSYLICLLLAVLCCWTSPSYGKELPTVLVTVAPHKFFVDTIASGTVDVLLMVPAAASAHTFEPTPKQTIAASSADIWFQTGEGFETRVTAALRSHGTKMDFVDLRRNVDLIYSKAGEAGCCHCCPTAHDSYIDPHFWLSPRQAKIQAATIANTLSQHYPQHQALYTARLNAFQQQLDLLDKDLSALLSPLKQRAVMVSHPAYGYFCRDYNLQQLSIEFEGKDPTPQQLTSILMAARANKIDKIFIQQQYSSKGARLIAREIGAKVEILDPYAEDYLSSLRTIGCAIASP
jgi:zinc transport system substrate-binding protein